MEMIKTQRSFHEDKVFNITLPEQWLRCIEDVESRMARLMAMSVEFQ